MLARMGVADGDFGFADRIAPMRNGRLGAILFWAMKSVTCQLKAPLTDGSRVTTRGQSMSIAYFCW